MNDKTQARVEYSSNNSGGSWWLKDADWYALEAAGWEVDWLAKNPSSIFKPNKDGRWLGALAMSARRYGVTLGQAIDEFVRITGQDMNDSGCSCCGPPHSFVEYDAEGRFGKAGPNFTTQAHWD